MSTKKILNPNVDCVATESLMGYLAAYGKYYKRIGEYNAIQYKNARKNKVVLVIGGGSGHEPLFTGFCGAGLADAVACGNICASPNPELIYETAKTVNQGQGVLFLYGCYAGDNLNFDMAEERCRADGIKVAHVRIQDDFASAPQNRKEDRRGIAGDVFVIKCAGAACDAGLEFDDVIRITEKARDNISTIGVATSPGTLPGNEKPTFEIADDEMEFGMGIHGEPGIERTKMMTADKIVNRMYAELKKEMNLAKGDKVAVLVNGLGSTPLLELNVVYYNLSRHLKADGIEIHDAEIKTYCTCMEMGGFSISFMKLDGELLKYYDQPCYSPYYAKGSIAEIAEEESECADMEELHKFEEIENELTKIVRSKSGILEKINAEDAKNMLIYIANKIIAKKQYLTEVDSAIGDGDHGIGMAGGMRKVKKTLANIQKTENVYQVFEAAGRAMIMSMGGASGVIFGSMYLAGAENMPAKSELSSRDLADMLNKSLQAIQKRGKAQVGDKTMVDALAPAVYVMEEKKGESLIQLLRMAEEAAWQGVENTKKYVARFGRAKSLSNRSIGYQDAGATSVWLILQGMREFVEDKMEAL